MKSLSPSLVQVYNSSLGVYTFKDKYYCRELTPQGFHDELRHFVHSGFSLRSDIISALLCKLRQLRDMIQRQDSFRFFSSSLLIVYDGKLEQTGAATASDSGPTLRERTRVLEGRESFSKLSSGSEVGGGEGGEEREGGANGPSFSEELPVEDLDHQRSKGESDSLSVEEAGTLVKVRMIDFAHATHTRCKHDPVKYSGPDEGYITGLNTLISAFHSMQEES